MKVKFKLLVLMTITLALAGCATSGPRYQEPTGSHVAVLTVKNKGAGGAIFSGFSHELNNQLDIVKIDGKSPSLWRGDSIKLAPGEHTVRVLCSISGKPFGSKTFSYNFKASHRYLIAYPKALYSGYNVDLSACKKLTIQQI